MFPEDAQLNPDIDPRALLRRIRLPGLTPATLALGREIPVAAPPAAAPPPVTPAGTPASTGPAVQAPVLSTGTGLPSLRPGTLAPPDPNDPRYQLHGAKKFAVGTLGALAGLGGHLDVARSLNPYDRALTAYNRNVEAKKTRLGMEDTESQIEERRAQAAKAQAGADKPESIDQELATATMDAIHRGGNPTDDPTVKNLIAVKNAAADKTGGPKLKDVTADADGNAMGVFEDGTTKPLGYKAGTKEKPTDTDKAITDWMAAKNLPDTPANRMKARQALKEETPASAEREQGRSDKSYEFNSKQIETIRTPVSAAAGRMGNLMTSIGQATPQADALIAPELLSIMAGGQGSGLRMNEAEISRIVGGRSKWESLQAAVNKWSTDPKTANSITPEQRTQIKALANAVNQKLQSKLATLEDAEGKLIEAGDPKEHRKIVAEARKKLDAIDSGATGPALPAGAIPGTLNGKHGYVLNGKFYAE